MAGTAKTTNFMIGSCTLMLGQMSDLYNLNPTDHSVGLVKNYQLSADPTFLDLTQGFPATTVFTTMTASPVKAQVEVYEYTARNLTYSLSLDGHSVATNDTAATTLTANIVANDTVLAVTSTAGMAVDGYLMISDTTKDDTVLVRKITDINSLNVTVDQAITTAWDKATTSLKLVNGIDIGSQKEAAFLSSVVTGKLPNGAPIGVLMPKVKITKGFTLAFNSEQYGNLPFEIELLDLVTTDTFYDDFKTEKARLFTP